MNLLAQCRSWTAKSCQVLRMEIQSRLVFDLEKKKLVDSLLGLQATAGTGLYGGFNGSLAEAPTLTGFLARQADLDQC